MTTPSQRRVTWAEVAEWLPDGEAEVAFDRDVAPSGLDATLYLRQAETRHPTPPWLLVNAWASGPVFAANEVWVIDEDAPLGAHNHDVRVHALRFADGKAAGPCRCRVWRGTTRGWERPADERVAMAKRGTALYLVSGGRVTFDRPMPRR